MIGRSRVVWSIAFASLAVGCQPNQSEQAAPAQPFRGITLTVAPLSDAGILGVIQPQLGEWEGSRGGTVSLAKAPVEPAKAAGFADVLVFPAERLGDLIDVDALSSLPESLVDPPSAEKDEDGEVTKPPPEDPLEFAQVFEPYQDEVTRYGPDRQGLALGGAAIVLVYRRQAMDQASERLKSEANSAGTKLEAPKTWEDLEALVTFLDKHDWRGDGTLGAGIAFPTGDDPERIGASLLLASSASRGLHPDFFSFLFTTDTMAPLIGTPPFVEALESLVRLGQSGLGSGPVSADEARAAFRRGEVALLIDRADRSSEWLDDGSTMAVAVAQLPGSERVYNQDRRIWEQAKRGLNRPSYLPMGGGWLVGVSSGTKNVEAALDLVRFLVEAETASAIRADPAFPTLPVRGALIGQGPASATKRPGLDRRSWSEAVSRTILADQIAIGLRIPEADGYINDLDAERLAALGGTPVAEALDTAAKAWNTRTDRLGRDRQLWHFKRSLLGFATASEPPPRH
jgi:multiple sugar transport system substrate-binding protein